MSPRITSMRSTVCFAVGSALRYYFLFHLDCLKIRGKQSVDYFQKKKIEYLSDISYNHFTTLVTIDQNPLHFFTYGFNGFICIRDKVFKPLIFIVAHHRRDAGIEVTIADPFMRYTISRGKKDEIVCMKLFSHHYAKYDKKYKETARLQFELGEKFSKPTVGFFPSKAFLNLY